MSASRRLLPGALLSAVLAGCNIFGNGAASPTFPQHEGFGLSGPSGGTVGTLVVHQGCLMFAPDEAGTRTMIIWPTDFAPLPDGTGVQGDGHVLLVGDEVEFGGGEYTDEAWVMERLVGPPMALECRIGRYVLVTSVMGEPER